MRRNLSRGIHRLCCPQKTGRGITTGRTVDGTVGAMATVPFNSVVRISAPGDLVCTITAILGFRPANSIVVMCVYDGGRRLGLVMRFDLEVEAAPAQFADIVAARLAMENAHAAFVVVFSDAPRALAPIAVEQLPHVELVDAVRDMTHVLEAILADGDGRWWSYLCDGEPSCGCGSGALIDQGSASATSIAAAYALAGHASLPDREAVVGSVALALDRPAQRAARKAVAAELRRHRQLPRTSRRIAMRSLLTQLLEQRDDPRASLSDADVTSFAALSADVVVRDEVLVRAGDPATADVITGLLRELARRIPPPYDAPVCTMLAWVAYSCGDGVIANIGLERALATDADYSLALLTLDALERQLPPKWLREVMTGAGDDMRQWDGAG
jgi:hypothetical protein